MIQTYMIFYSIKISLLFPTLALEQRRAAWSAPSSSSSSCPSRLLLPACRLSRAGLDSPPHGRQEGGGIKWDMVAHGGTWWGVVGQVDPAGELSLLPAAHPPWTCPQASHQYRHQYRTLHTTLHTTLKTIQQTTLHTTPRQYEQQYVTARRPQMQLRAPAPRASALWAGVCGALQFAIQCAVTCEVQRAVQCSVR